MTYESKASFKPPIPNDPPNRSYKVDVLDDGTTIITQQQVVDGRTATQVMGRIPKNQSFIPEKIGDQTLPNNDQVRYFTQNSSQIVKDFSVPTVLDGIGGAEGGGYSKVNDILGTNVSPPPGFGDQINLEPQKIELENENQLKIVTGDRLQYPLKMTGEQDKIKFTAVKIKPRTQVDTGKTLGFEFGKPEYKKVDGPVYLAIQAPISDQNSADWGSDSVNAINAALYKASYGLIESDINQVTGKIDELIKNIYGTAGAQRERIKRALAGQAASINNVLARTDNVVLNPNLELLFQGPQLRPFTFSFKMSAREPKEAQEIRAIIKYFKYHMAVRREKDQLFLRAPHVFTIQYIKGNKNRPDELHPGINLISPTDDTKACALTNFSVDYTPLGSYATYEDGTMVSYTMNMQFQEITPIYDTDYTKAQSIGF